MDKKEILCLEYNVFRRVLKHWEEFEEDSLPVVLNNILEEIDEELFTLNCNYFLKNT